MSVSLSGIGCTLGENSEWSCAKRRSLTGGSVDGLARTRAVTHIVLPMPISSHSQPERTGGSTDPKDDEAAAHFEDLPEAAAPGLTSPGLTSPEPTAPRLSTSSMNASDCFWYGRSLTVSSNPFGSAVSTG